MASTSPCIRSTRDLLGSARSEEGMTPRILTLGTGASISLRPMTNDDVLLVANPNRPPVASPALFSARQPRLLFRPEGLLTSIHGANFFFSNAFTFPGFALPPDAFIT